MIEVWQMAPALAPGANAHALAHEWCCCCAGLTTRLEFLRAMGRSRAASVKSEGPRPENVGGKIRVNGFIGEKQVRLEKNRSPERKRRAKGESRPNQ
jgi:hypothetical protein